MQALEEERLVLETLHGRLSLPPKRICQLVREDTPAPTMPAHGIVLPSPPWQAAVDVPAGHRRRSVSGAVKFGARAGGQGASAGLS